MRKIIILCMVDLMLILTQTGWASQIIQNQENGTSQILYYSPIGQTFTAEDEHIQSIGFWVQDFSISLKPIDFDLSVELFDGVGTGGFSLGSAPITGLVPGFDGFFDADFSSVHLTAGDIYTAIISCTTPRVGVKSYGWTLSDGTPVAPDPYTGGAVFCQGNIHDGFDLTFRIIPEPATMVLLALGGILLRRR